MGNEAKDFFGGHDYEGKAFFLKYFICMHNSDTTESLLSCPRNAFSSLLYNLCTFTSLLHSHF